MRIVCCLWLSLLPPVLTSGEDGKPYDLGQVEGMQHFAGSPRAAGTLARLGIVVVPTEFKQIFQTYIENPLPPFVTTDSAWHTYHVLFEEGVRTLEKTQITRLRRFSQRLLAKAWDAAGGRRDSLAADLARYAAVGLLLQASGDEAVPEPLRSEAERCVEFLRKGAGQGKALFFGLPLIAEHFRASSFYAEEEELIGYFRARQWYGLCNFRQKSPEETARALSLALLVHSDRTLTELYEKLTVPYDELLAKPDDASVPAYVAAARKVWGRLPTPETVSERLEQFRAEVRKLPPPVINDQFLMPDEYQRRVQETRGFRLLGPRRLPSAALFQNTVDPDIPGRMFPSGLDLFATGPLANDAARRALEASSAQHAPAILRAPPPPLPASLYGETLKLIALLQEPLPESLPAPLRRPEWSDKQLWTQLAAWAEGRHTWALHAKLTVHYAGEAFRVPGMVSPYPRFFNGLAELALRSRDILATHASSEDFDPKAAAKRLLALLRVYRKMRDRKPGDRLDREDMKTLAESAAILERLQEIVGSEESSKEAIERVFLPLERLARKAIAGEGLTAEEKQKLAVGREETGDVIKKFGEFADLCRRLAAIAEKHVRGTKLSAADADLMLGYGPRLGYFHFYGGNSYLSPRDNFPKVTPIFSSPVRGEMLYAGVARPEALYLAVPRSAVPSPDGRFFEPEEKSKAEKAEQRKPYVLLQGAVLSYREFRRAYNAPLADSSWREEVKAGKAPPPPPFATSFRSSAKKKKTEEGI